MKRTIILVASALIAISCSQESENQKNSASSESKSTENVEVPESEKETSVTITFNSGTMKGTYEFTPEDGNYMSQVNVGFDDNVSNLNASGIISEDGKHQLMITRPFLGEASTGQHEAREYTDNCGVFKLRSLTESNSYSIIRGEYLDCTATNVLGVGAWEESTVYNRRGVVAEFSDRAKLEVTQANGELIEETVEITVTIKARESRLK